MIPQLQFLPIADVPLNDSDVEKLLKVLASLDGHERAPEEFTGWMIAATAGKWTAAETLAAMFRLTAEFTGFRIMPGHVTDTIKALRAEVRHGWNPPPPPRSLADDPAREIKWRRTALASYRQRAILTLAQGGDLAAVPVIEPGSAWDELPHPGDRPELPAAVTPREVSAGVDALVDRLSIAARAPRPPGRVRRRRELDPAVRAEVRAEVAERAPVGVDDVMENVG